jgi:signal transduction histidine kinase
VAASRANYAESVSESLSGERARLFVPGFLPEWLVNAGPVLVIMLPPLVLIAIGRDGANSRRLELLAYLLVASLPLLWRHRYPVAVFAVTATVAVASGYGPVYALQMGFALYSVAVRRNRTIAIGLGLVAVGAHMLAIGLHGQHPGYPLETILSRVLFVGFALAAGFYVSTRYAYIEGLRDRAARAERERELLASTAVAEERVRIARELHDVVAHNVSLMVVQAQAANALTDDERRRTALDQIASLGRQGLTEMHRMLGVLRAGEQEPEAELAPQPGVADVERLVGQARDAGLAVHLHMDGEPRPLPPGADLSAYRIVQEALTNVVKHAGDARAEVSIRYGPSALELSVTDDGRGPSQNGAGGHGLVGMRERVALFGGELVTGPGPGGRGYSLRALLPFER